MSLLNDSGRWRIMNATNTVANSPMEIAKLEGLIHSINGWLWVAALLVLVGVAGEMIFRGHSLTPRGILEVFSALLLIVGLAMELALQPSLESENSLLQSRLENQTAALQARNIKLQSAILPRSIKEKDLLEIIAAYGDMTPPHRIAIITGSGDAEAAYFGAYIFNALHKHFDVRFHPAYFTALGGIQIGMWVFGKDERLARSIAVAFNKRGYDVPEIDPTNGFAGGRPLQDLDEP